MNRDRALKVLMSREFSIGYSALMTLAFGMVALYGVDWGSWAQLIWTFGAGVHLGMGFMWIIVPRITDKWRKQMEAEIEAMMTEAMRRAMHEAACWAPLIPDDDEPPTRRLQ